MAVIADTRGSRGAPSALFQAQGSQNILNDFLVTGWLMTWGQHIDFKPMLGAHGTLEDWCLSHLMGAKHFARQYCTSANVGCVLLLPTVVHILRNMQEAVHAAQRDTNRHLTKY